MTWSQAGVVTLDPATRLLAGAAGGLLVGGTPLRVMRLNDAASRVVRGWQAGRPLGNDQQYRLARRLHDDGLLVLRRPGHRPAGEDGPADVTVVVPVRDRAGALDRCLAGIGPCAAVIVVDDGSRDGAAIAAVAVRHGAHLVVSSHNQGPAAARNTGLRLVRTPLVALVDSDCVLPPGWLAGLLPALLDEQIAVVAPRVVGGGGPGPLARFELTDGPLDLGPDPGPVRPGARIGHVPAAVLLCRVIALGSGFDPAMRVGEDVDLVWRLAAAGFAVRYEPRVVVRHDTRVKATAWLRQRYDYGTAAAQLDHRHPGAVAPVVLTRWSLPMLAALATGHPVLALGCTAVNGLLLAGRLPAGPGRLRAAARLAGSGAGWLLAGLANAACRPGLPLLLPLAALPGPVGRRVRRATALAVAVRLCRQARACSPALPVPHWAALRLVDDLAYGLGVWSGALRQRRPAVVLPRIT